ncbi:MAG: tRNA (guanine-N1)-methyltransferase [Cyanophyceae cyanobacterium]
MASAAWVSEGKAQFQVGPAFYRSASQVTRDLGILAAAVYRSQTGRLRVLDAMSGCGVRSLRYWLESQADWVIANDANSEVHPVLHRNLAAAIASGAAQVFHADANRLFFDCYARQEYYDLVDVDSFGSPAPFLSTVLWATRIGGLIYLTSTDGRTATGHLPEGSLKVYGAYARAHPAAHEQALRLLIGSVQQQAATKELGIEPVFSLFTPSAYRVMLRLTPHPLLSSRNYGFLGYCHRCGDYQTISWRKLGQACCRCGPFTLSGPLWLGLLHDPRWLKSMQTLAQQWHWPERAALLAVMFAEADFPPYFYRLGEIGRRGRLDIPKKGQLIAALQQQGHRATATHIDPQAIKTEADLATCITVARSLSA